MFYVKTALRRGGIRVMALPNQRCFDQVGREVDVDPTLHVQFPRNLRTASDLVFAVEELRLVRPSSGASPFYRAGGRITGPLSSARPETTRAHTSGMAHGGELLRPIRKIKIVKEE